MSTSRQNHFAAGILICLLAHASPLAAADSVWKRLRYQGGTIKVKVNPFDWNTTLRVSGQQMQLVFAGQQTVTIDTGAIRNLSYGQKAYRLVADMAALSFVVTPVALFGLLHKSKDHLVGIQYQSDDGHAAAVLLTIHKDEYREVLLCLHELSGKPVENWP